MASSSRRRHCSNDPNIFCYVCGSFNLKDQRRNITGFVKSVYLAYFKVPLGDQDKYWAPHNVCKTCVETLRSWSQGKNAKLKFGVPMVWREPSNHLDDCYFCLINVKGFNKKNKQYLQYPSIPSAIRPVPHSEEIPVPIFSELPKTDDADLSSLASSDEEDPAAIFKPCDENCDKPILFNQCALNDLVRDLYLPKESAELLASRLQEHRMLKPGTNVTFYRNREVELPIVKGADLQSLTSRVVRQKLEKKLDLDLSSRRKEIDELVMAEVEDQTNSQSEEEEEDVSEEEVPPSRKKADSDSDAEVEDVDDKDEDDDYSPKAAAKKAGRKPKAGAKKRKAQDDDDSDEDWNKRKNKKGSAAAGGRGKKASAFTRSFKLSPELADVVGSDVMPRHEVVKKLWAVIKERELQDPKNKQYAICDDQLLKVFGIKRFRTFGMMKHLKEHFLESA